MKLRNLILLIIIAGLAVGVFYLIVNRASEEPRSGIRNVILVVFDTLRADRLSIYGHNVKTTPFLDSYKDSLLLFKRAKTASPWTVPSHATILTGKSPFQHKANWGHMHLGDEHETLAETLSAQGFCTSALVANYFFKKDKVNVLQGFQSVFSPYKTKREKRIMKQLASELKKDRDCRKFIFINFMNNHLPYNPGKYAADFGVEGKPFLHESTSKWKIASGKKDFPEHQKERVRRLYDASVRYSDALTELLIKMLKDENLLEESLVIITSDHGDGLGYHQELGHEISVWEEQLAVPLIMRLPDAELGGKEVNDTVSLMGLRSLILDLTSDKKVGIDASLASFADKSSNVVADYRNYFSDMTRFHNKKYADEYPELAKRVQHMHVLYCGDFKLHSLANGSFAFFNIAKDPHEQSDVKSLNHDEYQKCLSRYQALLAQDLYTPFDFNYPLLNESESVNNMDVEALKSLGYL